MSRVTIADIAAELGVSVPTVSKVLNGRKDVAPTTRVRVEDALRRADYQRRGSGRTSSASSSNTVELVFHTIETPWSLEIIKGAQDVAVASDLKVTLTELGGEHRPPTEWIDGVLERKPLGVILVLATLAEEQRRQLVSRNVPFVVVDTFGEPPVGIPTVGSNNWNGGLAATRHLIEIGHEEIAVISGPREYLCSRARVDGFRSAHDEAGIPWNPENIRWGDFDVGGGYTLGYEILSRTDRPTAIFAGSDYQALGVMRAARDLGLSVPEDVSIVGYDDIPVARWISPGLTTVNQPLREMAATATRMLVENAVGVETLPTRIDLSTELVVRESTTQPPLHVQLGKPHK